jgi:hypothetical protein
MTKKAPVTLVADKADVTRLLEGLSREGKEAEVKILPGGKCFLEIREIPTGHETDS